MRVLIAVDGSRPSEAALAAMINHRWEADTIFKLLHVVKPVSPLPIKIARTKSGIKSKLEVTGAAIAELASSVASMLPNINVTHEVQFGSTRDAILNTAKNWHADLIVLGTNSDLRGRRHLGSVSLSVLEGADRPVLIVRLGPNSSHLQQGTDFTRVILAIDDNDYSEGAVSWLAREQWNDDTMFKVMMVVPEQQDNIAFENNPQKAAFLLKEWSKTREKVAEMLKEQALALDRGVENELVSIEVASGNTKERIVATARGWKADLLVMGSRGPRSGIQKLLVHSVSKAVASKAPCSVLIIKGVDKEGVLMTDKKVEKKIEKSAEDPKDRLPDLEKNLREAKKADAKHHPPFGSF